MQKQFPQTAQVKTTVMNMYLSMCLLDLETRLCAESPENKQYDPNKALQTCCQKWLLSTSDL